MLKHRTMVTGVAQLFGLKNHPKDGLNETGLTINGLTFSGPDGEKFIPGTPMNKASRLLFMLLAVNEENEDEPFRTIPLTDAVYTMIENYYAEKWPVSDPPLPQPLLDALRAKRYTHVKIHWKGHGH